MTEKKCPMCNGECILKAMVTESGDGSEIDVCAVCGSKFPRRKEERAEEGDGEHSDKEG
jgi:NMD protein affecting ribosome stability and mRNA decay